MRVLIFGLGTLGGGFASASYFLDHDCEVRITDMRTREELGNPVELLLDRGAQCICGEHRQDDVLWADLVVKNPAVSPDNPYLRHAKKVTTDIAYLLSSPLTNPCKKIAVTGTKGKTTTVAAVTHVLQASGHEALQLGNMGISGFSILTELESRLHAGKAPPEYLVCELSSWQIRDLFSSITDTNPEFRTVALTSLFPDHLNRYKDYASYKDDKWLLFGSRKTRMIVPKSVYKEVLEISDIQPKYVRTTESFFGVESCDVKLQSAWAICRSLNLGVKQIAEGLVTFRGVPHRQEQLGVKNHVVFINDSSATIPEATTFSCGSCPWPYHLICGGTDKNLFPEGMLKAVQNASHVYLLDGSFTRDKLIGMLDAQHIPYQGPFSSMDEAFFAAYEQALADTQMLPNVAVILSPGAASFGLFRHEFDRGDQFRSLFETLEDHAH
jgi:UDP-N-acetylmuramoylalanine--D-glutamate ligase